jgi:uncharacterized protein (TIGR02145 family)
MTEITKTSATAGGNITSDGGASITARGVCWGNTTKPTIGDNKTTDGSGIGKFISQVSGLAQNATYYLRAYATNSAGTAYGNEITFTTNDISVIDYDGNIYKAVQIGDQVWMAENLKSLHYADGKEIKEIRSYEDNEFWVSTYARYYTWNATMNNYESSTKIPSGVQGVCPTNWHVPSDGEWEVLIQYLGGQEVAGGKLKEAGTKHWQTPNTGADNSSGFNALPSGYLYFDSNHCGGGTNGGCWVSKEMEARYWSSTTNLLRLLNTNSASVLRDGTRGLGRTTVRCVKD